MPNAVLLLLFFFRFVSTHFPLQPVYNYFIYITHLLNRIRKHTTHRSLHRTASHRISIICSNVLPFCWLFFILFFRCFFSNRFLWLGSSSSLCWWVFCTSASHLTLQVFVIPTIVEYIMCECVLSLLGFFFCPFRLLLVKASHQAGKKTKPKCTEFVRLKYFCVFRCR